MRSASALEGCRRVARGENLNQVVSDRQTKAICYRQNVIKICLRIMLLNRSAYIVDEASAGFPKSFSNSLLSCTRGLRRWNARQIIYSLASFAMEETRLCTSNNSFIYFSDWFRFCRDSTSFCSRWNYCLSFPHSAGNVSKKRTEQKEHEERKEMNCKFTREIRGEEEEWRHRKLQLCKIFPLKT